jgi:hypothetical protein
MTVVIEKITPEILESIKQKLSPEYKKRYDRRFEDSEFLEGNRAIHLESGNYMCLSAPWLIPNPGSYFLYVMGEKMFCFWIEHPSRPMLNFVWGQPDASVYSEFCAQVKEIFGVAGFDISIPGLIFKPEFPAPEGGAA